MPKLSTKLYLLDEAGYDYNPDRMIYINRQAKMAFSFEFVDDHEEDVLPAISAKRMMPMSGAFILMRRRLPRLRGTSNRLSGNVPAQACRARR